MVDSRIKKLAEILVGHSVESKKGSTIQLSFGVEAKPLALEIYKLLIKKGVSVILFPLVPGFAYQYYKNADEEQLKKFPKISMYQAKNIAGIISIGADYNTKEFSNIDPKKVAIRKKVLHPISQVMLKRNNWVGCEYPTNALAQDAEMSLEEFEDFVFSATNVDYNKMSKEQDKLKKILDNGSEVRIKGENTDIKFSIKGRTAIKCFGKRNVPDGEVFIAPVEKTVEGYVEYSYPAIYMGKEVEGVRLWFQKGRVIEARATKNQEFLNAMLDTDKGSRYLGEFGIGTNYKITKFIKQILFDEKIGGTIHLALGMAYKEGGGTNRSALHWDMVKDLRVGGEIYIDDELIQKNGKFIF